MNYLLMLLIFTPIGFFLLWNFPIMIFSIIGGWNKLSKECDELNIFEISNYKYPFQSVRLGYFLTYSGCITMIFYEHGFVMKPFFIISFFHKPIYIKYEQLENVQLKPYFGSKSIICHTNGKRLQFYGKSVAILNDKLGSTSANETIEFYK